MLLEIEKKTKFFSKGCYNIVGGYKMLPHLNKKYFICFTIHVGFREYSFRSYDFWDTCHTLFT